MGQRQRIQFLCNTTGQKYQGINGTHGSRSQHLHTRLPVPAPSFRALFTLLRPGISFQNKLVPCHCPVWKSSMAPHCLLEKPQQQGLAESGLWDSKPLGCSLSHNTPIQPYQSTCCPSCWPVHPLPPCLCFCCSLCWENSSLLLHVTSVFLRGLNVTTSVKLSLIHPGSYLLCPLHFTHS